MPCVLVVLAALLAFAGATASTSLADESGHGVIAQKAFAASTSFVDESGHGVIAQDGFGERDNSYAWSMGWFKGKLYVGTGRDVLVRRKRDDSVLRSRRAEVHDQPVPERSLPGEPVRPEAARRDLAVHARDRYLDARVPLPHPAQPRGIRICAWQPTSRTADGHLQGTRWQGSPVRGRRQSRRVPALAAAQPPAADPAQLRRRALGSAETARGDGRLPGRQDPPDGLSRDGRVEAPPVRDRDA